MTVGASTAAWVAGASSGLTSGGARLALLAAGAALTAVAVGVPLRQQARTARARADAVAAATSARAAMRIAMEDALDPFTGLLMQLVSASGSQKARLRGEAIQLALTTMAALTGLTAPAGARGPIRVRACFFVLDPGPPRALLPQSYAGRAGAPSVAFDETTRRGQYLLGIAKSGWVVVDDTAQERSPSWWDDEQAYRTYAAGPVPGFDGQPVGLLTLDALTPGELSALDLSLVRLQSHLLGLALQL